MDGDPISHFVKVSGVARWFSHGGFLESNHDCSVSHYEKLTLPVPGRILHHSLNIFRGVKLMELFD